MTLLVKAADAHFAWLLGEAPAPDGLRQPAEGLDEPAALRAARRLVADLHAAGRHEHWLIVEGGEIVGLAGLIGPPDEAGAAEIGFGVAPSRRGRRFAIRAVRLMVETLQRGGKVRTLTAGTAEGDAAAQAVLERNGFVRTGARDDAEAGRVIGWARELEAS